MAGSPVMRIGLQLPYAGHLASRAPGLPDYVSAGVTLVAVAEAYSFDAVSQLGYLAATLPGVELASSILPVYTRTPALLAMTAAGLDALTGGRFTLGLGASGPQVVEGFHGVPYDAPVGRTREVVQICRAVWRREAVRFQGRHYRLPLPPEAGGTGLGRPLRLINAPVRERVPILLAAMGPANVALAAEVADAWSPAFFRPESASVWDADLARGAARRDPGLGPLDVVAPVAVAVGEATDALLDQVAGQLALYLGGMGARGRNYYQDLAARFGFAAAAAEVQDLFLAGRRDAAAAAVPRDLARSVALVGSPGFVAERAAAFAAAGVTTLLVTPLGSDHAERVRSVAALAEIAG